MGRRHLRGTDRRTTADQCALSIPLPRLVSVLMTLIVLRSGFSGESAGKVYEQEKRFRSRRSVDRKIAKYR